MLERDFTKDSEYIIIIPDIQNYITNQKNNKYLEKIIEFIRMFDLFGYKVKAVLQVGDITNLNSEQEWETAKMIFSELDGKVNYILCTGNHDYGDGGTCNNRNSYFSKYFDYKSNSAFISSLEKNNFENAHFNITVHDQVFQIFSLEFAPRDQTIIWADSIAKANADYLGIILTHAYLYKDQELFDYVNKNNSQNNSPYNYAISFAVSGNEKINDGEEIWEKLVSPNPNLRFVLCGHQTEPDFSGNLISINEEGKEVFQNLFNTQSFPNGGDGWIQILDFYPGNTKVEIKTYSTVVNIFEDQIAFPVL